MSNGQKRFTALEAVQAIFGFVLGPVGQAIRALHLQIGHATVTAAVLVCATVGFGWTYWANTIYNLNIDHQIALTERENANRMNIELRNAQIRRDGGGAVTRPPWRAMAMIVKNDRVELEFLANKISEKLLVTWWNQEGTAGGVIEKAVTAGELNTVAILGSDYDEGVWSTDSRIVHDAYTQVLSDGQELNYSGKRHRLIIVPVQDGG